MGAGEPLSDLLNKADSHLYADKEAERSSAKFIPYRLNERASRSLTVFQSRLSRVEFELNVVSGFLDLDRSLNALRNSKSLCEASRV
ncbi:hypothetical protein DEA98_25950 [Brucella pseudogrignonensis]|nr:hypothetical protein [Brucella pseudogrignonensis]